MSTGFTLERSIFADGHLAFSGNVGYGSRSFRRECCVHAIPITWRMVRSRRLGSPSAVSLLPIPTCTMPRCRRWRFPPADDFSVGDVLEFKFGSELQTIQFLGHVTAFRPYASADVHLSPNTILEYAYATSRPDLRAEKGFDSAPADLSESNPRVSLLNFAPKIERAHHQELSLSRRMGKNNLQVAVFADRVGDPALTGTGKSRPRRIPSARYLLGNFQLCWHELRYQRTAGRAAAQVFRTTSRLRSTTPSAACLISPNPMFRCSKRSNRSPRSAVTPWPGKFSGTVPRTHTRWIASYRWVNGSGLTPVDMFNSSPGQSDPYLNFFVRQPIPCMGGHMEAIIDVRNLLAQGYIPVLGQDGQTVYLVQSARSVRGGVAFTF